MIIDHVIEIQPKTNGMFQVNIWNKNEIIENINRNESNLNNGRNIVGPLQSNMLIPKKYLSMLLRESIISRMMFNEKELLLQQRQNILNTLLQKCKNDGKTVENDNVVEIFLK